MLKCVCGERRTARKFIVSQSAEQHRALVQLRYCAHDPFCISERQRMEKFGIFQVTIECRESSLLPKFYSLRVEIHAQYGPPASPQFLCEVSAIPSQSEHNGIDRRRGLPSGIAWKLVGVQCSEFEDFERWGKPLIQPNPVIEPALMSNKSGHGRLSWRMHDEYLR